MALSADVLRALQASGATTDMIIAAVEADQREASALAAQRRDKAATKKRAQRASEQMSRFVPETNGDRKGQIGTEGDREALLSSLEIVPPSPPKGGSSPKGKHQNRGGTLSPDWQPKGRHFARAAEGGLNGAFIGDLADRMREWAGANSNRAIARKADWDLTFDGFIRRELEKRQQPRAGPRPQRRNPAFEAREAILAAGGDIFGNN